MTRDRINSVLLILLICIFSSFFGAFVFSIVVFDGDISPLFSIISDFIYRWQSLIVGLVAVSAAYYGASPVWRQLGYSRHEIVKQKLFDLDSQRSEIVKFQDALCGSEAMRRYYKVGKWKMDGGAGTAPPISVKDVLTLYGFKFESYFVCSDAKEIEIIESLDQIGNLIIEMVNYSIELDLEFPDLLLEEERYCFSRRRDINRKVLACAKAYGDRIRELRAELSELEARGAP